MFCGLGISHCYCKPGETQHVVGIENPALVARGKKARSPTALAQKSPNSAWQICSECEESLARLGLFDKMLIDPPREGQWR